MDGRRWTRAWVAGAGVVALGIVLTTSEAGAIPAFARKYRTTCTTCHVVIPKLNDFGEAFRLNGFKIPPDDELLVKDEPVSLGAEAARGEWPSRILPATIPGLPPIAAWVQMGFTQVQGDEKKFNFGPPGLTWLLGANIGGGFSFFLEQGPKQRGYLKVDDILNNPLFGEWAPRRLVDLRIGLLEPDIVAFSDARRIPLTNHLVYTFDYEFPNRNGNPFRIDRQVAAELSGIAFGRVRYVLGVTNGSNDGSDNNSRKDVYGRVAAKLMGMAFTGKEEVEESLDFKENWTDNSVTAGVFAYLGSNTVADALEPGKTYDVDFGRFGVDLRANWKLLDLVAAVSWGEDKNPGNDDVSVGILAGFVEADCMLWPWLMAYGKYEWLAFRGPTSYQLRPQEVQRTVVGVAASVFADFRISFEYVFERDLNGERRDDRFLFRADLAF